MKVRASLAFQSSRFWDSLLASIGRSHCSFSKSHGVNSIVRKGRAIVGFMLVLVRYLSFHSISSSSFLHLIGRGYRLSTP